MSRSARVAIVAGGYVAAYLVAKGVVAIHTAVTQSDRSGADGMYAFGDSLYFLAAFGLVALIPTAAALVYLRPYRKFWLGLTITGVRPPILLTRVRRF